MKSRLAVLLAAAPGFAACIPARDNPNDPSNRVSAALTVSVEGAGSSNQGSRTSIFLLDASGTEDPKGRTLTFAWDLDGDSEPDLEDAPPCSSAPLPCIAECPGGGAPCLRTRLTIEASELPAGGVGSIEREVGVSVRAGSSADEARAGVRLTNGAPVLSIEEEIFVPDRQRPKVLLDGCRGDPCASFDPDGDTLDWNWELLRGDAVLTSASSPAASFVAPEREQALLFRVTLSDTDGLARVSGIVHVYVTNVIWLTTVDPTRVYRVFPDFRVVRDLFPVEDPDTLVFTTGFDLAQGGIAADSTSLWVGVPRTQLLSGGFTTPSQVVRNELGGAGDYVPMETWEVPAGVVPSVAVSDGVGCAAVWAANDPAQHRFSRFIPGNPIPTTTLTGMREPRFVHPGPGGTCWAVSGFIDSDPDLPGGSVWQLDALGNTIYSDLDVLFDVSASTHRGDGSLWVAGIPDPDSTGATRIRIYAPPGAPTEFPIPLEIDALAARAAGGVYAHDAASGETWIVESDGSMTPTPAPELFLPGRLGDLPPAEPRMYEDPIQETLWIVEAQGRLIRLSDGLATLDYVAAQPLNVGVATGGVPNFAAVSFDPAAGHVLAAVRTDIHSGIAWVPDHLTRVVEVFIAGPTVSVSADPSTGGAWIADGSGSDAAFRRIGPGGATQVSVPPPGTAVAVVARSDGSALGAWTNANDSGGVVPIDASGVAGNGWSQTGYGLAALSLDESDGTICVLGIGPDLEGVLLRGNVSDLSGLVAAPAPAAPQWTAPMSVAAHAGNCWATFQGDFITSFGELARWDGVSLDRVSLTAPGSLDVDRGNGDTWVVARTTTAGDAVFRVDAQSLTPELRFGDLPVSGLLDVQRGSCAENECLTLWVVNGQEVEKRDAEGAVRESFFVGEIGSLYDFDVLP